MKRTKRNHSACGHARCAEVRRLPGQPTVRVFNCTTCGHTWVDAALNPGAETLQAVLERRPAQQLARRGAGGLVITTFNADGSVAAEIT